MSHDLGPFFQSETAMNQGMRAAVGASAADTWVRMMVAHHEGEIAMAQVLLREQPSSGAANLARSAIAERPGDIAALRELMVDGEGDYEAARIYLPTLDWMHDAMMSVQGAGASTAWARKMLQHHRGAVKMTDVLLMRDDVPDDVRKAAHSTKAIQIDEIAALERLLRTG